MKKIFLAISIAIMVSLSVCIISTAQTGVEVRVNGATSMYGRVFPICKQYMKEHAGITITVTKDRLVDEGIEALVAGDADIAMASRKLLKEEVDAAKAKGIVLDEHFIGYGGIVIIGHPSNPIDTLTMTQVQKIFNGEYTNWKQLNGKDQEIVVFKSGPMNPGTLTFFNDEILNGNHITNKAIEMPDFTSMMSKVTEVPNSIGYTRIRDSIESEDTSRINVKSFKIKTDDKSRPVTPSRETIQDGSYPLKRPYFLITRSGANEETRSLVSFIVSKGWGKQWR